MDNAKQLSDFMCYFNGNLAKEIGRRTGWKEKVWGRRYQAIVISDEEEVQVARLRYVLSHGVKEGLVARVEEWPGVHCAVPLMTGAAVEGTWFDRTREYNARLRGKELEKGESASTGGRPAEPAPLLAAPGARRSIAARIREIVREIDESAAAARAESLIPPLGPDGVRAQNPETRPQEDQEVAGAVLPCPAEEGPEGAVGGLWACSWRPSGRRPRGGGRATGGGVPGGELPARAAVRDGLRRGGWRPGDAARSGGRRRSRELSGRLRARRELAGGWGVLAWLVKCSG